MTHSPAPRLTSRARLQQKLDANKQAREQKAHEAAVLAARLRQLDHTERRRLQAQVGQLADDAGLLAYDLATLRRLFTAVVRMSLKDPRAVGEFLGLDAILHGEVRGIVLVDDEGVPLEREEGR